MRDSLDPLKTFNQLLKGWWKIVILAALGGLVGLGVTFLLPAKYQAEAIIHASIDFTEINYENMVGEYGDPLVWTQFEEDLALQVVKRMVQARSNGTYEFALTLDPDLSKETFLENYQIERYLSEWYLRYRHEDPKVAQEVVNFWAGRALQSIRIAQKNGNAESFVIVDLVSLADEPTSPVYHQRGTLVLAGTAAGFFSGILLVDFKGRFTRRDREV
jgi:uncharacterized protein involved in exopolysaccharide biosynthesis